jgi:hypothetical protein
MQGSSDQQGPVQQLRGLTAPRRTSNQLEQLQHGEGSRLPLDLQNHQNQRVPSNNPLEEVQALIIAGPVWWGGRPHQPQGPKPTHGLSVTRGS